MRTAMPVKRPKKQTDSEPPSDKDHAIDRARKIAARDDYEVHRIIKATGPYDGVYEVLFIGRYLGNGKAQIPGDTKDTRDMLIAHVEAGGDGCVSAGW